MAGIVIGLSTAVGCDGLLRGILYQVQPVDPVVMLLGVMLVSAAAVLSPSWRASHVVPQVALRSE